MIPRRVDIYPAAAELESAALEEILGHLRGAVRARGVCAVALSGGETPRSVYRKLAAVPPAKSPDWSRVHLCFGDERMVSPDDPASNYGMVREELICRIPLPAGNVHRIRGEREPGVAAAEYAADLERTLPLCGGKFDLVLLGLGGDGHTASLFPGTDVLEEREKTVRAVYVAGLSAWRVTVTLPVINNARSVLFIVAGAGKREILHRVLDSPEPRIDIPATLVSPAGSVPRWIVDEEAAGHP